MIVDYDYYVNNWGGRWDGTEPELDRIIDVAEHIINNAAMNRLSNLSDYPESVQIDVKKAICSQTDYIIANGGMDYFTSDEFKSMTLGNFSYSVSDNSNGNGSKSTAICCVAETYLLSSGLMYRGL